MKIYWNTVFGFGIAIGKAYWIYEDKYTQTKESEWKIYLGNLLITGNIVWKKVRK